MRHDAAELEAGVGREQHRAGNGAGPLRKGVRAHGTSAASTVPLRFSRGVAAMVETTIDQNAAGS
jgi:hypothetical protein